MRKIFMTWMILCLSAVALGCGNSAPEVDDTTGSTELIDGNEICE